MTTIRGTDQTSIESASVGNSVASIAAERTRGEASAALYASSTAGGQCGQVGVTKTSIARSRSSAASRSSDSGRSDDAVAGLEHGADQRAELVAPRKAVVAHADVLALRQHGDCGVALEARRLVLDAEGDAVGERRDPFDDPLRLGAEVDVAGAGQRRLLRAERDEQLDGALERVEQLAHAPFLVGSEDRHRSGL